MVMLMPIPLSPSSSRRCWYHQGSRSMSLSLKAGHTQDKWSISDRKITLILMGMMRWWSSDKLAQLHSGSGDNNDDSPCGSCASLKAFFLREKPSHRTWQWWQWRWWWPWRHDDYDDHEDHGNLGQVSLSSSSPLIAFVSKTNVGLSATLVSLNVVNVIFVQIQHRCALISRAFSIRVGFWYKIYKRVVK